MLRVTKFILDFCGISNRHNMKRQKSDHRIPRDEALYEAYKNVLKKQPYLDSDKALEEALKAPQPRMWVSFYGVYRILLRIIHDSRDAPKNKARNSLELEIREKYERLKKRTIFSDASAYFLTSFIIAEPSNGFFVSFIYAKKVVGLVRKKHQSAWKKKAITSLL